MVGEELDVGLGITERTWADDLPDASAPNRSVQVFLGVNTSRKSWEHHPLVYMRGVPRGPTLESLEMSPIMAKGSIIQ